MNDPLGPGHLFELAPDDRGPAGRISAVGKDDNVAGGGPFYGIDKFSDGGP